jgi:hypothetical protein
LPDDGANEADFLIPEGPVFTGVRIETRHRQSRLLPPQSQHHLVGLQDRALQTICGQLPDGLLERTMGGYQGHRHRRGNHHHGDRIRPQSGRAGVKFGLPRISKSNLLKVCFRYRTGDHPLEFPSFEPICGKLECLQSLEGGFFAGTPGPHGSDFPQYRKLNFRIALSDPWESGFDNFRTNSGRIAQGYPNVALH